ncbi:MAG: proline hydroxylase [Candidatus Ryanbacteria bacterium RIFCSPLOWO2_02_FULL_45_11c]|uniref:Proline hydroxylase n=1 Tax=Candidatus Ryanbacteria bacterium RIFCSPLOWO2_02_FULL_45_11c TaxID=1802128 RepID=A0A1G2GZC1_9BACT|nr:MAG: proline hydroxylase [Candidatus Ryanbacteria bacterium RIFCSPLOWO2_02_FULL_45_11c]
MFFFDPQSLKALAEQHHAAYVNAAPFPHIVIDNFLPEDVADRVVREFPLPETIAWKDKTHEHSKKLACQDETKMPPFLRQVFFQFNGHACIRFLEGLTGIKGLIPDPHLEGGGLHQIQPGGYLDVHADFNRQVELMLDRRLNLLLYLNKDWREEYGGHLELWNKDMTKCGKRVLPIFNRCVVFSTSDFSYHGHPQPLTSPPGVTRKSLALYYYTNGRPVQEVSSAHSTLYQSRPGEQNASRKAFIKKLIPPILYDIRHFFLR